MKRIHNYLLFSGLLLILAGFLFGLTVSWSNDHQARLVAHDDYAQAFSLLRDDHSAARAAQFESVRQSLAHRRSADTHTHSVNLGLLLILVSLLSPLIMGTGTGWSGASLAFAGAAWIYPLGLALQFLEWRSAGEIVAAVGAVLVIAAFGVFYARVLKSLDDLPRPTKD